MSGSLAPRQPPVVDPDLRYDRITEEIIGLPSRFPHAVAWRLALLASAALVGLLVVSVVWLFYRGVGVWGVNIPVDWGIAISNFVWWIGIAHAGTLISALLLLSNQGWRNSLNRFAEAATVFAILCAAIYPVLHLGRPFYFFFMIPYPSTLEVWPQFRSPLAWDIFEVSAYMTVSVLFWYIGLIPDLATARDRSRTRWRYVYGLLCLGWSGSGRQWARWRTAYYILAAISLPLVGSVYWGVGGLFAGGPVPGWHSTLFPVYFLIGAIFSGFALVGVIAAALRGPFGLRHLITEKHLNYLGLLTLATGFMTLYGYVFDAFGAWYAPSEFEWQTLMDRWTGTYAGTYWAAVALNFLPLQLLWFPALRRNPAIQAGVGLCILVGMWFERYMLVVAGLYRDWLESSVGQYEATFWDWSLFAGLVGFFLFAFLLFIRFIPMISAFEIKELIRSERTEGVAGV